MPAKLNASDTIALLCSVDAKFENSFKKRNDFLTHILRLQSITIDCFSRLYETFNTDCAWWPKFSYFFSLISYITENEVYLGFKSCEKRTQWGRDCRNAALLPKSQFTKRVSCRHDEIKRCTRFNLQPKTATRICWWLER